MCHQLPYRSFKRSRMKSLTVIFTLQSISNHSATTVSSGLESKQHRRLYNARGFVLFSLTLLFSQLSLGNKTAVSCDSPCSQHVIDDYFDLRACAIGVEEQSRKRVKFKHRYSSTRVYNFRNVLHITIRFGSIGIDVLFIVPSWVHSLQRRVCTYCKNLL